MGREWLVLSPQLWATARGAASGCSTDTAPSLGGIAQILPKKLPDADSNAWVCRARGPHLTKERGPGRGGGGHGAATGNWPQGRKHREKQRKGFKKTETKESDGEKRMQEGGEKRRRDSRGLQGANFLTERQTQHPGTTQTDTRPPDTTAAPPLLPSCQPRAVPAAPTRPRARPRHG